ncbi:MAG TPA: BMC domain-containing protein [candidate division Zixibacteria bacterium]|nr:BMC domain-containing protein [candidate division Zixibacteria bacterium]
MSDYALGLIETFGLVGAIEATDAASKAAAVTVTSAELTPSALMTIKIEGELGAVQAAVEAGAKAAQRIGYLVAAHVIPNPDDELEHMIPPRRYVSKYHPGDDRPRLSPGPPRSRPPVKPAGAGAPAQTSSGIQPPAISVPKRTEKAMTVTDLASLTVVELRRLARGLARIDMAGREISKANKKTLIDAIKRVLDMD